MTSPQIVVVMKVKLKLLNKEILAQANRIPARADQTIVKPDQIRGPADQTIVNDQLAQSQ
jgi:hypothetical protein